MLPLHDDNPTERPPLITVALIVACVLVFLWQISLDTEAQTLAVYALGSIPAVLFNIRELPAELVMVPTWATVFTSMFLHGGWMHLLGNMLYLWIFGNNVEDAMGHVRFIFFYLLCGTVAVFAQALPDPESQLPMVGASGAISGVLGAYLLLFPHARVLVGIPFGFLLQTLYMPASLVLVLWFGLQLLSSWLSSGQEGGVAFGAHVGGFVAGLVLIPLFKRREVRLFAPRRR
jgi:membrane associated rhomboid family serine protease